ncbi:ParB/RepB/Spo0J family partition protein [Flavobacterium sp.]|uniref:ParB/RepB/Spo0J family partition protein n=1 Tax=Flavobacterium sp. TaxID=239 RepID=UPI0026249E36|nr:ParB/RepB/Spo0J family partition protein [Flavobacterium sp.]
MATKSRPGFQLPPPNHGSLNGQGELAGTNVFTKKPISDREIEGASAIAESSPLVASSPTPANTNYLKNNVYPVLVENIDSNPYNPRTYYPPEVIDEFCVSIANSGQHLPGNGYVNEKGRITLIDGETRLRAIRSIGKPTMEILIVDQPTTPLVQYLKAREINHQRIEQTPLDDAASWKKMLENNVFSSQQDISDQLNIPKDHVSRIMSLARLPKAVSSRLSEEREINSNFSLLLAILEYYEVCNDTDKCLELIIVIMRDNLSARDVKTKCLALKKDPIKRPRSNKRTWDFRGDTLVVAVNQEKGNITLQNIPKEKIMEVEELIKNALSS